MIEEIKSIKGEISDIRKFGITIGILLVVIAGFLFWKEKESFRIFITVGIVFFVFGATIPELLKPIYWIWMVFASILNWVMTRVIISLIFYFIVTPTSLLFRIFGKQFLDLRWDRSNISYWNYRKVKKINVDSYEKQF